MSFTLHPENETDPVRRYTSPEMLQAIEERLERTIRFYAAQPPELIAARIQELKREWSIERYLQVNVSVAAFLTAFLALTRRRGWALVTCTALGFFLYHALQGFDPPIPLLRKFGARTRREIDREIYALKALRGDFNTLQKQQPHEFNVPASEIIDAVNA
jgi:hypothetical protein